MESAIKAGRRIAAMGRRAKKTKRRMCRQMKRNKRLGVFGVMKEIREDMSHGGDLISSMTNFRRQGDGKRGATAMGIMRSNKRYKPGD